MFQDRLKSLYNQWVVGPLLKISFIRNTSSNIATLIATIVGCMSAPLLYFNHPYWAVFILLFSSFLDTIDGSLARIQGTADPLGCSYDLTSDRIVEIFAIVGLVSIDPTYRAVLGVLMVGAILVRHNIYMVMGVYIPNDTEKGFYYAKTSIMNRLEQFILLLAMVIFPTIFIWLSAVFIFLMSFDVVVLYREFIKNLKKLKSDKSPEE